MGDDYLSPRQEDMAESRQRIKYKYAVVHMDTEPETARGLREEINRIIADEMGETERELLKRDIAREMEHIRNYHDNLELPE